MKIQLINHASVKIFTGDCVILTDPWFSGSTFNNGWSLICKNNISDHEILNKVNYIWISHEHPDHFDVQFFKRNFEHIIQKGIVVLFQETLDKRVIKFLNSLKILVQEIKNNISTNIIGNTSIIISKAGYYDSMLFVDNKKVKILNTNDCDVKDFDISKTILNKFKNCDLLLTQFSYAAWKGNESNKHARIQAAKEKLLSIKKQYNLFAPKNLMPFASFIYFSHKDNSYMNDQINTIDIVFEFIKKIECKPVILRLNEIWNNEKYKIESQSLEFWKKSYENISEYEKKDYLNSYSEVQLNEIFKVFQQRIFEKNSRFIIKLIKVVPFLNFFKKINFYITDLDSYFIYDIKKGFVNVNIKKKNDVIEIHSSSLFFLMKFEFGFDTLTVNGLFNSNFKNFSKLAGNFSISSYNALGKKLTFLSFLDFQTIKKYFGLIFKMKSKYRIN